MSRQTKVLHVLGNLRRGGAESFILNTYRNINIDYLQFDFVTRGHNIPDIENEVRQKGGKIYNLAPFPKHFIKNYMMLKKIIKGNKGQYQAIHVHANSLLYLLPLKLAKKYKIPIRIIHSHNTEPAKPYYKLLHYINRFRVKKYVNIKLACSQSAGKWMFGKSKFEVIHNAIDLSKFTYNEEVRIAYRERFHVSDRLVIGNVGRLVRQKNQEFLLDIFFEIKRKQEAVLMIIGEGELEKRLREKAESLGIINDIIFLKNITDTYNYLQMMDVFVMPSLYEGLSVSLVEAQASGMGVVMSDTVTGETVLIEENVCLISLEEKAGVWADRTIKMYEKCKDKRTPYTSRMTQKGFNIREEIKRIEKMYGL